MKSILLILLYLSSLFALEFTGIGYGSDEESAKREAISNLSHNIRTDVDSSFQNIQLDDNGKINKKTTSIIKTSSHLPIVGAEYKVFKNALETKAIVSLSLEKAEPFYRQKLQDLYLKIEQLTNKLKTENEVQHYSLLNQLLLVLDDYNRFYNVAIALGMQNISLPLTNKYEVNSKILSLNKTVTTLEQAAKLIATTFTNKNIFVYPAKAEHSDEVTPFAKAMVSHIKGNINTLDYPKDAKFALRGEYQVLKKGLILRYSLYDINKRENINTITITFLPTVYAFIRTEPLNISFEKLLQEGILHTDDLQVSLSTNKGDESVLFTKGEEIELFVKLNHSGYFYIVGHTQAKQFNRSYLVELEESIGKACFIRFVSSDDANHWMSLGKFNIEEPFGLETLQVIASNQAIRDFPFYHYDKKSGFNIIDKDIKQGLYNTRSIMKSKKKKEQYSEAILTFTTYE